MEAEEAAGASMHILPNEGAKVNMLITPKPFKFDFEKIREAPVDARWNMLLDILEILDMTLWLPMENERANQLLERFRGKGLLEHVK